MLNKPINTTQLSFLQPGLKEQLSNKHPLYILAEAIDWQLFEDAFRKHYREDFGRLDGRASDAEAPPQPER